MSSEPRVFLAFFLYIQSSFAEAALKTLGVITPTTGVKLRATRGSNLKSALSRVSLCASLTWGGCGGREFPRTGTASTPGTYIVRVMDRKFSVKVVRHIDEKKLWKTKNRTTDVGPRGRE